MTTPQAILLLGRSLRHSISPAFQNAAFESLGLPFRYEAREVQPDGLPDALAALRTDGVAGANVTVPYKAEAAKNADLADDRVRVLEAANTLVNRDGRLEAHNTDVDGFARALADAGFDARGRRAVVLGAGGAARAVVLALHEAGVAGVVVVNRTLERAEKLARDLNRRTGVRVKPAPWDRMPRDIARADLLVNCTTVGMRHAAEEGQMPLDPALLPPAIFVCDIVANPLVTPLLAAAARRGCRTLGGLPMLVRQGALSFEYWTGRPAPIEVMFRAAEQAMQDGVGTDTAPMT